MNKLTPLTILAAFALAACNNSAPDSNEAPDESTTEMDGGSDASSGNSGGSDDMTTETSSSSGRADRDFVAACLSASNMSESMCTCLAEKADADLSENSQQFLIATLNEDQDRVVELRTQMSFEEMSSAGMFMIGGSTECAREGRQ